MDQNCSQESTGIALFSGIGVFRDDTLSTTLRGYDVVVEPGVLPVIEQEPAVATPGYEVSRWPLVREPLLRFSMPGATLSNLVWLVLGRQSRRFGDDSALLRDNAFAVTELVKAGAITRPLTIRGLGILPSGRAADIHLWRAKFSSVSVEPSGVAVVTLACLPDFRQRPGPLFDYSGKTVLRPEPTHD